MKKYWLFAVILPLIAACSPTSSTPLEPSISESFASDSITESDHVSAVSTGESESIEEESIEESLDPSTELANEFELYPISIKSLLKETIGDFKIPYIKGTSYEGTNSLVQYTSIMCSYITIYEPGRNAFDDYTNSCEKYGFIIDSESHEKYNYAYLEGSSGTLILAYAYYNKAYPYLALEAYVYSL